MSSSGPNSRRAAIDSKLPFAETLSDEAWAKVASWVISSLGPKERTNARAVLAEHPVLATNPNAILRLALEEFSQVARSGETLDVEAFVAKFPEVSDRLRQDIELFLVLFNSRDSSLFLSSDSSKAWPVPGQRFADYELRSILGGGPESRVYRSVHVPTGEERVLKLTRSAVSEITVRRSISATRVMPIEEPCRDEAWGLVGLPMPLLGVRTVHDFYERAWRRHRRPHQLTELTEYADYFKPMLSPKQRLRSYSDLLLLIALQTAYGLDELHREGYVHGDVKPANLLISEQGLVYLLDFDLAHPVDCPFERLGGTPQFAPPEHLERLIDDSGELHRGQAKVSMDIFSFGATVYLLATGRFPFGWLRDDLPRFEAMQALLERHRMGPRSVRGLNPDFDARIARLIEACLAFVPDRRPRSMQSIIQFLEQSLRPRSIRWRAVRNRLRDACYRWFVPFQR